MGEFHVKRAFISATRIAVFGNHPFLCVHSHQVQMRANSFWVYTELAESSPR